MIKKLIFTFMFFVCFNARAADFTASVNRNPVPVGETVVLTLDYSGKTTETPDFSVLEKDFTIISVGQSFRSNFINGQTSNSQQWTLVLIPTSQGEVIIPSVSLGNDKTSPIALNIVAANNVDVVSGSNNQPTPKYSISGAINNQSPYVQQQINYQLTITDSGGLQGSEPYAIAADDEWIIRSLGKPEIISKIENGKKIREIRFNYALFPQKSGRLKLPQFKFDGFYLTKSSRAAVDPFADLFGQDMMLGGWGLSGMFATRNPILLVTPAEYIDVKPIPVSNRGIWWLPAEDLTLSASFNNNQQGFKVGEAITRTITLTATGIMDKQLPELSFSPAEGLKQYPEKPQIESYIKGEKIIVVSKINNVYIPTQSGQITIPEISISWFNTSTGKIETSTLPAEKINVAPESIIEKSASFSETEPIVGPENKPDKISPTSKETSSSFSVPEVTFWLIGAFFSGIFISWLLFRMTKGKSGTTEDKSQTYLTKSIIESAKTKDIRRLRDSLIEWASKRYTSSKVTNLQDVITLTGDINFAKQLQELNKVLYSSAASDWDETAFLRSFNQIKRNKSADSNTTEILPELYKK